MAKQNYEIGMVGLGVMGRNLVLNMADHGYSVSGYDKDLAKVQELQTEAGSRVIHAAQSMEEFVSVLSTPRVVMLLVPAGKVVETVIHELIPQLERGDLIIDAGNSHFKDTDVRAKALAGIMKLVQRSAEQQVERANSGRQSGGLAVLRRADGGGDYGDGLDSRHRLAVERAGTGGDGTGDRLPTRARSGRPVGGGDQHLAGCA